MAPRTKIEADRGDTNVYDLDVSVPVDAVADKVWFTCKRRYSDSDVDAVVKKGLNVAGLSGIVVTDGPNGKFQVQIGRSELESVEDFALLYDCQFYDASQNAYFTVQSGSMVLSGQVTRSS